MDTQIIEMRKNIIIINFFNDDTSSFSEDINIDFIPDEMAIKIVNYDVEVVSTDCLAIYSDLVSDFLVSFPDSTTVLTPHNFVWTLRKPVRGKYNFNVFVKNEDNILIPGKMTGPAALTIHLEFVKYRTSFPDKKIF